MYELGLPLQAALKLQHFMPQQSNGIHLLFESEVTALSLRPPWNLGNLGNPFVAFNGTQIGSCVEVWCLQKHRQMSIRLV